MDLTGVVIGSAIDVHRALGPGLLESAYQECLCHELRQRGVAFTRELTLPIRYKDVTVDCGYRIDLLVESSLVVEIKSTSAITAIHRAQLLTYMKLGGWRLGLLINFNVPALKSGIRRLIL